MLEAVLIRLRLRKALLNATSNQSTLEKVRQDLREAQSELENLRRTRHLAEAKHEAFDEKVQRRLASTVPPRPVVKLGFDEAHAQLKQLVADSLKAIEVIKTFHSQKEIRVSVSRA